MDFRIADTFTDSLARLSGDEQKSVKTTTFDLQVNPSSPGLSLHKLDKARDKHFWSVRVSGDIRIILHRTDSSLLLCYVDHHDKAYAWAERRKLETHPTTGAAQLVEIRETVKEIVVPVYRQAEALADKPAIKKPIVQKRLFTEIPQEQLLGYGVPSDWLEDVRQATESTLLELADHLPAEAAEALLELATGGKPRMPELAAPAADPFEHPDAKRRFRVMNNVQELTRALDYPWEKWTVFLHPEQQQWVQREYAGPARVSGSAGTGKTIVALHRAVYLARHNANARVLLTTFSETLANQLRNKLRILVSGEPSLGERIDVYGLNAIGQRLFESRIGKTKIASQETLRQLMSEASKAISRHKFQQHFLLTEWEHVVDAWQLETWESYRDVARLGRKTRLPEGQRKVLWAIFDHVRRQLQSRNLMTQAELFSRLAEAIDKAGKILFDHVVVDEAQDIGVPHLRFLAAMGGSRPNGLFFAGDLGQRIFQQPFSWKALGVDVRGRSRTLRVNYRTSHQIRSQADRLLGQIVTDVDGNVEDRSDAISVFNGPAPRIASFKDEGQEITTVGKWIGEMTAAGVQPHEIGLIVRSASQLDRAKGAAKAAGIGSTVLDDHVQISHGSISVCTMHLAKGLEFRAVAVMACDDEVIPLQERIESVGDDADLREVYETERHLLYVACTRARDHLLITSVAPASEFLDDMRKG